MKKVIALSVLSALLLSAMLLSSCISKAPDASTPTTEDKLEIEPLSDKHSAQIVKEYTNYMKENEKYDPDKYGEFYIEEYCGTYNSADIVVFSGGMEYDGDGEVRVIAGVRLQYDAGKPIMAYRRGNIYTLEELYSKKLLDRDDFTAIAEIHNKCEFEIESLSEELYEQIINDYTTRLQTENNYDPEEYLPFEVIEYCGTYNGAVAVMLDGGGLSYLAVIVVDEVADVSIHYGSSNQIWLWKDGDFLTVKEAFEQGVLTADNVSEIADIHNGGRYFDIVD